MDGLMRLRVPVAEDIVLLFSSICFVHEGVCQLISFLNSFGRFAVDLDINLIIRKSMYTLIRSNYHEFSLSNIKA